LEELAGHDFVNADEIRHPGEDWTLQSDGSHAAGNKAVKSAVLDFLKCIGGRRLFFAETAYTSWYFRK
jgi:hypothetical protein